METRQEEDYGLPLEVRGPEAQLRASPLPAHPMNPTTVIEVREHNVLIARSAASTTSSSSDSSSTCPPNSSDPICAKNVGSSTFTLPIILGVTIPVVGAIAVFLYLHRRHIRKQRIEDAMDRNKYKSMDFGLDDVPRKPGKGGKAGAVVTPMDLREKSSRHGRGLSLDISSPYILPPELHNSRESLHSLSRNHFRHEDPYRPVSDYQNASARNSFRNKEMDASSIYTKSSGAPSRFNDISSANLLSNASRMSRSDPPVGFIPPPRQNSLAQSNASLSPLDRHPSPSQPLLDSGSVSPIEPAHLAREPGGPHELQRMASPLNPQAQQPPAEERLPFPQPQQGEIVDRQSYMSHDHNSLRMSENYLASYLDIHGHSSAPYDQPHDQMMPEPNARRSSFIDPGLPENPEPARQESLTYPPVQQSQNNWFEDVRDDNDGFKVTPPSPGHEYHDGHARDQRHSMDMTHNEYRNSGLGLPGFNPQRLSMGLRPLPPDEVNEVDDPEARANRIRSFYREYFDDSKPTPQGGYYEDYDENYLGDAAYYDPDTNAFVMPYAQPVTRRAMTPPPGAGPRFRGQGPPRAFHGSMGGSMGMGHPGPRHFMPPPDRPFSSASNRRGLPGPRGGPRGRPLPPPSALNTLPTPSKLKDDSFAIFNAMDFAPPSSFKERVAGRSQSPLGERRPYSPSVPAYKPLASSYDELSAVPSPYLLRKSGTFTGLDFAPPRKFRGDGDTMSDAGSIRSNRSGVSALQNDAIRKGAYRVSRLPGDMVFSKNDLSSILKPTWEQRQGP